MSSQKEKTVEHQFDSFCKKTLKLKAREHRRKIKTERSRQISMEVCLMDEIEKILIAPDCDQELQFFEFEGEDINIADEILFEALSSLTDSLRSILLLSYFFGFKDKEIAEQTNSLTRTIQRRRTKALNKLKKIMEDSLNDK